MGQWCNPLAAHPGKESSVLGTTWRLTLTYNSSYTGPDALFWPQIVPEHMQCTHIHEHNHTKKSTFFFKK